MGHRIRYSAELRERAVRLVLTHEREHAAESTLGPGMMLFGLLLVAALVLAILALVKYLRGGQSE